MRNWQAMPSAGPAPLAGQDLLFTPGPRLGWVFRDRRELAAPYPEPEPSPHAVHAQAVARLATAEQAWQRTWKWVGKPSIGLALLLVVLAGCARSVSGNFSLGLTAVTIATLCGPGFAWTGWQWLRREQARDMTPEQEYREAMAGWDQRATDHESAELARLAGQPEWGSATIAPRRTDVFGGTLAGWQALLTVHGASLLASRPLLAIDLTGQHAAAMLTAAAQRMGIPAAVYRLPHDLGRCGILGELSPAQLADAVAEALHAGIPGGARTDRTIDTRVLQQLGGALAGRGVTPQRLAAAVRAALGHAIPSGILSTAELELLAGDLFPGGYREQIGASLVRLDAVMTEVAAYASDGWPAQPERYTCLTLDGGPRTAAGEILTALIAHWLTVQVSGAAQEPPAVLVAGADEIARRHLERLAETCDLRGAPVTLLFRHLREDAAEHARRRDHRVHAARQPHGSRAGRGLHRPPAHLRRLLLHRHPRRVVAVRRHVLERHRDQAARLRIRRRADRAAEPSRLRAAARRQGRRRPATARGRMRPGDQHPARREHRSPAATWHSRGRQHHEPGRPGDRRR